MCTLSVRSFEELPFHPEAVGHHFLLGSQKTLCCVFVQAGMADHTDRRSSRGKLRQVYRESFQALAPAGRAPADMHFV